MVGPHLILYRSGRVVYDSSDEAGPARPGSILVDTDTGRIVEVGHEIADTAATDIEIVDLGDLLIFPGLVDSHVHINDPGRDHWETFPNATKVTTTAGAYDVKLGAAQGRIWADVGFVGGLVPRNAADPAALTALLDTGVVAVKAFMCHSGIDDYPGVTLSDLDLAMPILAARRIPLMVHAELECSSVTQPEGDPRQYRTFLQSRPDVMEISAIEAIIALAEKHSCHVHIVHLSTCRALPALAAARARQVPVTVETCPHYLSFTADQIADGQTLFKCCPPIRDGSNRDALWRALLDEQIDMIVSDHSPSAPDIKCVESGDFIRAWGGIAGLQFRLLSVWTEGRQRGVTFSDLCKWLCENPAKLMGLEHSKGRLRAGYDADFVVWDPDTLSTATVVHHLHPRTPYESMRFTGRVHSTYRRGRLAYSASSHEPFTAQPSGSVLRRPRPSPLCNTN